RVPGRYEHDRWLMIGGGPRFVFSVTGARSQHFRASSHPNANRIFLLDSSPDSVACPCRRLQAIAHLKRERTCRLRNLRSWGGFREAVTTWDQRKGLALLAVRPPVAGVGQVLMAGPL